MFRTILLGFIALLLWCPARVEAQEQLNFASIGPEVDFSPSIVTNIVQDQTGFLWIGTGDGLFRYDGYEFKEFGRQEDQGELLKSTVITGLCEDQDQNIWIATEGGGLYVLEYKNGLIRPFGKNGQKLGDRALNHIIMDSQGMLWVSMANNGVTQINPKTDSILAHYLTIPGRSNALGSNNTYTLLEDKNRHIWVGTFGGGLSRIEPLTGKVTTFKHTNEGLNSLASNTVEAIFEDRQGHLWVGTTNGLNLWDPERNGFYRVGGGTVNALSHQNVKSIAQGPEGKIWIGTREGLNVFDAATETIQSYYQNPDKPNSLENDRITCLFLDQQNMLWIGNWGKAINRLDYGQQRFFHWNNGPNFSPSISDKEIKAIHQTAENVLWIGTSNRGVNRLDRKTNTLQVFDESNGLSHNTVYSLAEDAFGIWIGTSNGLNFYDKKTGRIHIYKPGPANPEGLPSRLIWDVFADQQDQIWIGTDQGLSKLLDHQIGKELRFQHFQNDPNDPRTLSHNTVKCIYEDREGGFWVGTEKGGLNYFDQESEIFTSYRYNEQDELSIASDYIFSVCVTKDGNVWVGTPRGASLLDRETGFFSHITEKNGLPNNFVHSIYYDVEDIIWMSTNRGLFRYDPISQKYRTFNKRDGLQDDEFNGGAHFKDPKTNELFFGGVNGLNAFLPKNITENNFQAPVAITKFKYYRPSESKSKALNIPKINQLEELSLDYQDNILSFEIASLNYLHPEKNQFQYQLEGFSTEWFELGTKRELTFTNLDPGNYTLRIKGSNNDGVWSEKIKTLDIYVAPPWWQTPLAKISFGVIGVLMVLGIYYFQLKRRLEKEDRKRLEEIDSVKNKFFTNITHEFRTPLTVILGMAGLLKGEGKEKSMIIRSGRQMLNLVNQMLDLRKLESHSLPKQMVQADIIPYTKYIFETFEAYADERKIQMHFLPNQPSTLMDFDPDKILRIFSNLLSNAIKYNREGGTIYFQTDKLEIEGKNFFGLKVKDTGVGIEEDKLPHVFDRFYRVEKEKSNQVKEGSGIGLSLTKELVKLFEGTITVRSKINEGSTFTVLLPITNEAERSDPALSAEMFVGNMVTTSMVEMSGIEEYIGNQNQKELERVLIIEDNLDVAEYLRSCLEPYFSVLLAIDGEAGVNLALEQLPDIVISDVMMPKKDGFEVLQILKTDERTNHIPVIMLSAKADLEARLKGLERGADAYLAKPFHQEELFLHIRNQLLLRKTLQEQYQNNLAGSKNIKQKQLDPFLEKAQNFVLEHLNDDTFGVNELFTLMAISRTQLHLKLKALTGESTTAFINGIRLLEGQKQLLETEAPISDIAWSVGFSDPNYFTRLYSDLFGESPTETRKRLAPAKQ